MSDQNRRCIVLTGATRGLGRALVAPLIALGHTVHGCGRSAAEIAELTKEHGAPHSFTPCDVGDAGQVRRWADGILKQAVPDLLINNAAIANTPAPLWQVPADEFDRVIDINIKGVVNVIRAFVPAMVEQARGVIVNLSSGWGRSTSPKVAPYCATKWAIEGLTQALAQELPKGMAAVPLNPGIIDTDMLRVVFGDGAGQYWSPQAWAEKAAPFLLKLGAADNGKQLTVSRRG